MKLLNRLHKAYCRVHFYLHRSLLLLLPNCYFKWKKTQLERTWSQLQSHSPELAKHIQMRVDYYNKQDHAFSLLKNDVQCSMFNVQQIATFRLGKNGSTYYLDSKPLLRLFPPQLYFCRDFGDVTYVPANPSLVKSRPIRTNNQNSVVLKLDSVRHFYVYPDKVRFEEKRPMLVWRGASHQPHRQRFLEQFHDHHLCDVGCVHKRSLVTPYHRAFLTIAEQLQYRYILSIEGNDVATNLKWILSSNSLCFMVKPKYETWLMEGLLEPNVHYVLLKDDYSDLEEKIQYYNTYPEEAKKIITNANIWMKQFFNKKQEVLVNYLVLKKYFSLQKPSLTQ